MAVQLDRVLPPKEAALLLGISKSQLAIIAEEDSNFPPKVVISQRCFGWRHSGLEEFINSRTQTGATL